KPLSGGLPGRRSGTPPAQAPPPHPATDRSGSVPSWVKSERRMAHIGILSTTKYTTPSSLPSGHLLPGGEGTLGSGDVLRSGTLGSGDVPRGGTRRGAGWDEFAVA